MKSSKLLWRIVGSVAVFATLLFLFSFIYAAQDIINPKPTDLGSDPTPTSGINEVYPEGDIVMLALGDSLTKGTGDTSGEGGYVGKAQKKLSEILKQKVNVSNQAVNGWQADNLLPTLEQPNIQSLIKQADIILLTVGGNDLNRSSINPLNGEAETEGHADKAANSPAPSSPPEIDYAEVRKNLPAIEAKLEKVLTKIAALNPKAKIVYIGLYNPYYIQDFTKEGSAIIQEWNSHAIEVANRFPNMVVVPTFDLFQSTIKDYLAVDEFHPNSLGYARIADRVVQALL